MRVNSLDVEIRGTQANTAYFLVLVGSQGRVRSTPQEGALISLIRTVGSTHCKINFANDFRYKVVCVYGLGR
jgi:hypothetical protein